MNSLNSILLEGRLTADPDHKVLESGKSVCNFSIASERFYKVDDEHKKEVSFVKVEVWAGLADSCNQYLEKGRGVRIVGRIKQHRWVKEGENQSEIRIVAEHVEFKPKIY